MGSAATDQDTVRRIQQATGRLATLSAARMDAELAWFRRLPAEQRSWVMLVAQAGVQSFVDWLRSPDEELPLTRDVFGSAPRELTRSVSLQNTVELIRLTITVLEENLAALVGPAEEPALREQLLRFSREIAFAAARVYAEAAETRGSWDARLEALVIDGLVSGAAVGDGTLSQVAALGWRSSGPVVCVVGGIPDRPHPESFAEAHRLARRLGLAAIAGLHGDRLLVVLGGVDDPLAAARALLGVFADGPVAASHAVADLSGAGPAARAALSALRAMPGWPSAPRPAAASDLLPERALAGDTDARAELIEDVYRPLADSGAAVLRTVAVYLESGGSLERTARTVFVHPNTVRYRLRRATQACGFSPTDPRGAWVLRIALTLGRLSPPSHRDGAQLPGTA